MNPESKVRIFWLVDGRLIFDVTPISLAEAYGDCLGHARSHLKYWTEWQRANLVARDEEYEDSPRGRVVFDVRTGQWIVYADKCIREKSKLVRKILRNFGLAEEGTLLTADEHYRCRVCLRRIASG